MKKELHLVKSTHDLFFRKDPIVEKKHEAVAAKKVLPTALEKALSNAKVKLKVDEVKNRNPFLKIISDSELLKR